MQIDHTSTRAQLLELLRQGRALTQSEITDELSVESKRHARRLLNQLRDAQVDVHERQRGREKEYYLPPAELTVDDRVVPLTERQALALTVAAEAGRAALRPTPLAQPLDKACSVLLDRLERASGTYDLDRLRDQWHFGTQPAASTFDAPVFDSLVEAMNEGRPVRIEYEPVHTSDAPRRRKVSPLVMAAPGGSWRCIAYCHYREAPRDFTLSRIESVEVLRTEASTWPEDFEPGVYFRERFHALGGETEVVRLRVGPDAARYFQEKSYHPTQVIEEEHDDGSLLVSFEVAGLEDIASWIRSWGTSLTVVDPPKLARRIANTAREVAAQYSETEPPPMTPDTERPDA